MIRTPHLIAYIATGLLAVAVLVAAYFLFKPGDWKLAHVDRSSGIFYREAVMSDWIEVKTVPAINPNGTYIISRIRFNDDYSEVEFDREVVLYDREDNRIGIKELEGGMSPVEDYPVGSSAMILREKLKGK